MERNEISYQFSGCKVSLAWFSKAQESLDYSFTQLRNSYVYSIISTVGMIIGRFERLVAKLIEISLERKKEEGKKGGERERRHLSQNSALSEEHLSKGLQIRAKMRRFSTSSIFFQPLSSGTASPSILSRRNSRSR